MSADLTTAGVTYNGPLGTGVPQKANLDGRKHICHFELVFGNGSDYLYPSTGVPLLLTKIGLIRNCNQLEVFWSGADGLIYEFDIAHTSIRIFYPTHETGSYASRAGTEFGHTALATTTLECWAIGW